MTFGQMLTAMADRLGLTGETTMRIRLTNEAKDDFQNVGRWPFLRVEAAQLYATSARTATLATTVVEVEDFENADGLVLDEVDWDTYQDLYRADVSTATTPSVWSRFGNATTGAPVIHFWPIPSAWSTGKSRHWTRVENLTTDSEVYAYIPPEYHNIIVDLAEAKLMRWEDDPRALEYEKAARARLLAAAVKEGALVMPAQEPQ